MLSPDVLLGKVSEAEVLEIQTEWMTSRTLTIAPGLHKDVQLMGGTARRQQNTAPVPAR